MVHEDQSALGGIKLNHILWTLRQRSSTILLFIVFGLLLSYVFLAVVPPKYKAAAQFLFDPATENAVNLDNKSMPSVFTLRALDKVIALIQSPEILKQVAQDIISRPRTQDQDANTVIQAILADPAISEDARLRGLMEQLDRNLTVRTTAADQIVIVEYQSDRPEEAAAIANLIVKTFIKDRTAARQAVMSQATQWLEGRSADAKEKLVAVENKIHDLKVQYGFENDSGSSSLDRQVANLRTQLSELQGKLSEAQSNYNNLASYLEGGDTAYNRLAEIFRDGPIERLRTSLAETESQLAGARSRAGESHPDVLAKQNQILSLRREIRAEARRKLAADKNALEVMRDRDRQLREEIAESETKLNRVRDAEVRLRELQRERDAIKTLYETMLTRLTQTTQAQQQTFAFSEFRPILDAAVPKNPKLNPTLIWIAGGIAGLGMGIVLSLLLGLFSDRLVHLDNLDAELPAKMVACVPAISSDDFTDRKRKVLQRDYLTFCKDFPDSLFTNSLVNARLAISESGALGSNKIILLTSPSQGDGKSLLSANLACLSSFLGDHTLLIDLDTRKRVENSSAAAAKNTRLHDFIHENNLGDMLIATSEPGGYDLLKLRLSGEANWTSFFKPQMQRILDFARDAYGQVWIDTPPAQLFSDALILAPKVDGVVLVAAWSRTSKKQLKETHDLVQRSGGKVLGVLINMVKVDRLISEAMVAYKNYYGQMPKRAA